MELPAFQIQTHVDPLTGCVKYYTPQGRFIHIPPQLPRSDWANDFGLPWWKDSKYEVGILASKTRRIRIVNTLTLQEHVLEVSWASCHGGRGSNGNTAQTAISTHPLEGALRY